MNVDNPYESPTAIDVPTSDGTPDGLHAIGIGFLGGAFVGGTAGAVQGAVLAAITLFSVLNDEGSSLFVDDGPTNMDGVVVGIMAATIVGALVGALLGCVVGPMVGGAARAFGPGSRRMLMVFGVTISTFGAVIISVFAIRFLTGRDLELWLFEHIIAVFSAILTGFTGGVVLVRGITRLLWPDTTQTP